VSLKERIERELGVPVRVRAGAPGSFNVFVDGKQIYSKKRNEDLPNPDEILQLVREKASAR